ncbi:unnamed protein product [Mytilus edulis]|uniref:Uncharacterized protein n=1 Tax=Mytilus edulis TaxID=6550 RepID=A0A8S3R4C4_MYTED|nr:unnamed protein product [Mytilus edulis]
MICIFLFLCLITVTKLEDPCFTTKLIDDWRRSVANAAITGVCDNFLEEGWYRVISSAGELMPTECPIGGYRCGTTSPFWLSSSDQLPCPDGLTSSTGFTPGCVNSSCSGIGKLKEARPIRCIMSCVTSRLFFPNKEAAEGDTWYLLVSLIG